MRITITARHCEIPDALRGHAQNLVAKVANVGHRPREAEVVFDADHGSKIVEIKVRYPRSRTKVASAEAPHFRTALDRAVDKLRNQLDKTGRRTMRRDLVS